MSTSTLKATNRHINQDSKVSPASDALHKGQPGGSASTGSLGTTISDGSRNKKCVAKSQGLISFDETTTKKHSENGNWRRRHSPLPRRPSFAEYKNSVCSISKEHTKVNTGQVSQSQNATFTSEHFRNAVTQAVHDNKIFAAHPRYPFIRSALEKRGWVEKINFEFTSLLNRDSSCSLASLDLENSNTDPENDEDKAWVEAQLRNYPPDLIFKYWRDKLDWDSLLPRQLVNQHVRNYFTTKIGIASCSQQLHWQSEPGVSVTNFCRCYRLCNEEERQAFIEDYRLSTCVAFLRRIVDNYSSYGDRGIVGTSASTELHLDINCLKFAVKQVNNYVKFRRHEDIDRMSPAFASIGGLTWESFVAYFHNFLLFNLKLSPDVISSSAAAKKVELECVKCLEKLEPYWPHTTLSGSHNVWIVKPGAQSRGKGIVVLNHVDKILNYYRSPEAQQMNWVVQKYIERPLLVYGTKFDIRQWFMVTDWQPLTVWFYRNCYLRFCTTPFDIEDFHESVHLCNNQVQCRYENFAGRNAALPVDNMWSDRQFREYLESIGEGEIWDSKILPGMKQGILGILRASQDIAEIPYRKNCFEIYGADFLISEDFTPWLIEINMSPCLDHTSKVTEELCPRCLEDCLKVVLDLREDPSAHTGAFELIYQQPSSGMSDTETTIVDLSIEGKAVPPVPNPSPQAEEKSLESRQGILKRRGRSIKSVRIQEATKSNTNVPQVLPTAPVSTLSINEPLKVTGRNPVKSKTSQKPKTPPTEPAKSPKTNEVTPADKTVTPSPHGHGEKSSWSTTSIAPSRKAVTEKDGKGKPRSKERDASVNKTSNGVPEGKYEGSKSKKDPKSVVSISKGISTTEAASRSETRVRIWLQDNEASAKSAAAAEAAASNSRGPKLPVSITDSVSRRIFGYSIAKNIRLTPTPEKKQSSSLKNTVTVTNVKKPDKLGKPAVVQPSRTFDTAKHRSPSSSAKLTEHKPSGTATSFVPAKVTNKPSSETRNQNDPRRTWTSPKVPSTVADTASPKSKRPSTSKGQSLLPIGSGNLSMSGSNHRKGKTLPTTRQRAQARPRIFPSWSASSELKTHSLNKIATNEAKSHGEAKKPSKIRSSSAVVTRNAHRPSDITGPKSVTSVGLVRNRMETAHSYPTAKPVAGPPAAKIIEKIAAPFLSQKDVKSMVKSMFKNILDSPKTLGSVQVARSSILKKPEGSKQPAMPNKVKSSKSRSQVTGKAQTSAKIKRTPPVS